MPETYPKLPPRRPTDRVNQFVDTLTQSSLEERIAHCLTVDVPELWRREFGDADESDLPKGLIDLIDELEHWCNVEFDTPTARSET